MNILSVSKRPKAAAVALALALGIGGLGFAAAEHALNNPPATLKLADPNEGPSHTGFAPVVKKVLPTVVNISSTKMVKTSAREGQMPDDDFFRQFFGGNMRNMPNMPREQRERGLGSGVIVSPEGYILTNNHVVDGANQVKVTLADKREYNARVVGTDPKIDIAVVKIEAGNLPAITVGDSSKIQIGDYALAVGNPFGLGKTVTMGIISATGRNNLGIEAYEDFIQTDAPINPGNSGGALINDRGELIGINTAILSHGSEGNQGIGFAVPANLARTVMDQILKNGKVTRAYLGIVPQDVTPAIAKAFGVKESEGALVGSVSPDSPASKAGLQNGDIILQLNGKAIDDANQLRMTVSMMAPGTPVSLKVLRNGSQRDLTATLGELPVEKADVEKDGDSANSSEHAGISVQDMSSRLARQLGVPANTSGVVVTEVNPNSAAADAGLQRGDVIQEVNRKPVRNTSDFESAMRGSKDQTLLLVNRQGNTLYVAV